MSASSKGTRPQWTASETIQLGAVILLGAAVRFVSWGRVFTPAGIRFAWDTDPNYHVLQAERFLRSGISTLWFDPQLSWPEGAITLWPPLFDVLIGAIATLLHGAAPSRHAIERVAVILPPVIGVLTIVLVFLLGRALLGRDRAMGGALLVAALPAHALPSSIGAADQHVAEIFFGCAALLTFVFAWQSSRPRSRRLWSSLGGIAVAASFWNWMGSAVTLIVTMVFVGASYVFLSEADLRRRIAEAHALLLSVATVLLVVTASAWGAPGALAEGRISGITGLHVAIVAGGASFGWLLLAFERMRAGPGRASRRLAECVASAAVPALAAFSLFPGLQEGVRHGLAAAGTGSSWHAEIEEYRPLLLSCKYRLIDDIGLMFRTYGLVMPAALLSLPWLRSRWRAEKQDRTAVIFLASWVVPFTILAFMHRRFASYMTIPMALLAFAGALHVVEIGLRRMGTRWRSARLVLTVVGLVVIVLPTVKALPRALAAGIPGVPEDDIQTMRWLGDQPSPTGLEGVLATWDLGHLVRYYAHKPVVVSPFGTDVGARAMQDAASFNLSADPSSALRILEARRVGFVVLSDPFVNAVLDQALIGAPPYVLRECGASFGRRFAVGEHYEDLVAPRLFYLDGLSRPESNVAPIDRLRFMYESASGGIKIFGVVKGATLHVSAARPSTPVTASVQLATNRGRQFTWSTSTVTDASGEASVRVPYATGLNGATVASRWYVSDGTSVAAVDVDEMDVKLGRERRVRVVGSGPSQSGP